jgi:hypothetical protein
MQEDGLLGKTVFLAESMTRHQAWLKGRSIAIPFSKKMPDPLSIEYQQLISFLSPKGLCAAADNLCVPPSRAADACSGRWRTSAHKNERTRPLWKAVRFARLKGFGQMNLKPQK